MSIRDYTNEELQEELVRRAEEEKTKVLTPKSEMDWSPLIQYLESGIQYAREEGYAPKDFDHFVFEIAMEVVYGRDVWSVWNKMIDVLVDNEVVFSFFRETGFVLDHMQMKKRILISKSVVYGLSLNCHGKTFWCNHKHGVISWVTDSNSRTIYLDKRDALWSKGIFMHMTGKPVCYEDNITRDDIDNIKVVKITRRRYTK